MGTKCDLLLPTKNMNYTSSQVLMEIFKPNNCDVN